MEKKPIVVVKKKVADSFDAIVLAKANVKDFHRIEPLTEISYEKEICFKNCAFSEYLKKNSIGIKPESLIESPLPRNYRTTSKRSVLFRNKKLYLAFEDITNFDSPVYKSLLEPENHALIYDFIYHSLIEKNFSYLTGNLNYIIIRGNYTENYILLNVSKLNNDIVRKCKILSERIVKEFDFVKGIYLFYDPSKSNYYLEANVPANGLQFKKIFGSSKIFIRHNDVLFSFLPIGFSQINQSVVDLILGEIKKIISQLSCYRLLDLYCGYGLFSVYLSSFFKEAIGIDLSKDSIESAKENSLHCGSSTKFKFYTADITQSSLIKILPAVKDLEKEVVILDPPRFGIKDDVIDLIADRNPQMVIHIFCGIEEIPKSLLCWKNCGYIPEKIIPFDMFPGVAALETVVILKKEIKKNKKY